MASGPITSWQIDGKTVGKQWKQCQTLSFWAPITADGDAAMKLKDAYSLEDKL